MADVAKCLPLERSSVQSAHKVIKHLIHQTPLLTCQTLNGLASTPQAPDALVGTPFEGQTPARPKINFFFKCENFQRIGAFKIRGASYALTRLSDEELKNGVVTHSSGDSWFPSYSSASFPPLTACFVPQATMRKPSPSPPVHAAYLRTSSCQRSQHLPKSQPRRVTALKSSSAAAPLKSAKRW